MLLYHSIIRNNDLLFNFPMNCTLLICLFLLTFHVPLFMYPFRTCLLRFESYVCTVNLFRW